MYLKQLLSEMRPGKVTKVVEAYSDNEAAIAIAKSPGITARTKHFERWITYVRDLYQRHIIDIRHRSTDNMPADIFTKALPKEPFTRFRSFLLGM